MKFKLIISYCFFVFWKLTTLTVNMCLYLMSYMYRITRINRFPSRPQMYIQIGFRFFEFIPFRNTTGFYPILVNLVDTFILLNRTKPKGNRKMIRSPNIHLYILNFSSFSRRVQTWDHVFTVNGAFFFSSLTCKHVPLSAIINIIHMVIIFLLRKLVHGITLCNLRLYVVPH